jgi:hypothetical protein
MSFVSCLGVFSATVHTAEIIHHTETQGTQRSTSFSVFSAFFAVKLSLVMNSTVNDYVFQLSAFVLPPSALDHHLQVLWHMRPFLSMDYCDILLGFL